MIRSDASPVQFWFVGYDTYNEKELFGINPRCYCKHWECDDEIKDQFQEDTGLSFFLDVYDEGDVLIKSIPYDELSEGVYLVTFTPSEDTPDVCDQKVILKIRQGVDIIARSDCQDIREVQEGTVYINYSNARNYAGMINYMGSPDVTYNIRIPAVFNEEQYPETDEVQQLSNNRFISLNSQVKKQRLLETEQMPMYEHLKMMEVLKQQFVTIDDIEYVKEEPYQKVENKFKKWPMRRYTCWLTEKEYVVRNIL